MHRTLWICTKCFPLETLQKRGNAILASFLYTLGQNNFLFWFSLFGDPKIVRACANNKFFH